MKKIKYISVLCILVLFTFSLSAQKKRNKKDVLKITGVALLKNEKISDYSMSVYLDGRKIDSIYIKSTKSINFYVQYNQLYTVHFQKKDCIDKLIIINTQISNDISTIRDSTFQFEVEMTQSFSAKSNNLDDYAVTVLYIDKNEKMLQATAEHNKIIHTDESIIGTDINNRKAKK